MTTTTQAAPTAARPAPATGFTIERSLDLQAAPDRVWRALTEPAGISAWFGTETELEPRLGAEGWFGFGDEGRFAVRIDAFEPGRRLVWRWAAEPPAAHEAGPTTLDEWTHDAGPAGGTRLGLRETGLRTERNLEMNTTGWFEELAELREHLASEPWQRPIRRTMELRADRDRVWRALTDEGDLLAWWGSTTPVAMEAGTEGWFTFPEHGRHAVRIEVVEPPRYLAWRWTADETDVPLAEARQPLVTEWTLTSRDDGGTTLQLMESGFTGPAAHGDNTGGWDGEVLPGLVRLVDGDPAGDGDADTGVDTGDGADHGGSARL
jgi:uncharacterized protein YndB with AHSA1/START domain